MRCVLYMCVSLCMHWCMCVCVFVCLLCHVMHAKTLCSVLFVFLKHIAVRIKVTRKKNAVTYTLQSIGL